MSAPVEVVVGQGIGAAVVADTPEQALDALEGNICRCTGYQNIVDAIEAVAR